MNNNVKNKAISGAIWEGVHNGGATLIAFISTIVLARLLTPEDYGYIGMLAIFIAIAETFINGGFGSALIQKKSPTDEDYSSVFVWNVVISVLLYVILFICAPLVADFYRMPLLKNVLRVEGIVMILNALRLIPINILRKKLQFKPIAIIEVSVAAFSLILTIFLAWKGFGVWSLVSHYLVTSGLTMFFYWLVVKWKPSICFSVESMKELFSFGGFMLLSSIVNQIYANIQGLLIGKQYSATTMGFYSKAKNAEDVSVALVARVCNSVSFPLLSEYQDNQVALLGVLRKIIKFLIFVTVPMMALLILIAKPVFILLYSERWIASVPYFRILCLAGIFTCVEGVSTNAIAALGKGRVFFKQNLAKKIIGVGIVFWGIYSFGLYGLLVSMVLSALLNYFLNMWLMKKYVGYSLTQQFRDLFPILLLALIGLSVGMLILRIHINNIYVVAIIQTMSFLFIYIAGGRAFRLEPYFFAKNLVCSFMSKVENRLSQGLDFGNKH